MEAQWKSAVDMHDQKTDSVPQQSSHNVSLSLETLTVGLESGAVLLSTWPPQTSIVLASGGVLQIIENVPKAPSTWW